LLATVKDDCQKMVRDVGSWRLATVIGDSGSRQQMPEMVAANNGDRKSAFNNNTPKMGRNMPNIMA
jgi:hypothetical protein